MNYTTYIAKRYLFSKSGNNAINIIVKVASFGVVIVAAAFIIVLSGFSGIRSFNLDLLKMTDADLIILPTHGKTFSYSKNLDSLLKHKKAIDNYTKVLEEKVFVTYKDKQKIAKLKGVDSNYYRVIALDSTIFAGNLPQYGQDEALIGVSLANALSLYISSSKIEMINVLVPKPGKGIITDPRKAFNSKYFVPVGIYQTTPDHDGIYIYTNLPQAQELLQLQSNQISAIEIKLKSEITPGLVQKELQKELTNDFTVKNRQQQNQLIYKMLNTENLMVYFIFALILLLALFNIIGSIIMIIIDKKNDINILRFLGLNHKEIKKIFMIQGFSMTFFSGIIGMILGLILVGIQIHSPFLYIPGTNMPYPIEIHLSNIAWVLLTLLFLGGFSTYIAILSLKKR